MAIDIGKMRHRVTLERNSPTQDRSGELQDDWSAVGTYWACVRPLSGRELVNAAQVVPLASHSVTMRNVGPLTTKDRLVFESRVLEIGSVLRVDEMNEFYAITATEQIPANA